MNTCDSCKWWGHETWIYVFEGYGNRKICGNQKVQDGDEGDDEVTIFKSIDSSIVTGPKFGCIHWQEKE